MEVALDAAGVDVRSVTFHDFALFVDDELGEVPFDKVTQDATLLLLHVLPQGMGVIPIDVDLLK